MLKVILLVILVISACSFNRLWQNIDNGFDCVSDRNHNHYACKMTPLMGGKGTGDSYALMSSNCYDIKKIEVSGGNDGIF